MNRQLIERLESRQLLSAAITMALNNGTLTVTDNVKAGDNIAVIMRQTYQGEQCRIKAGGVQYQLSANMFSRMVINCGVGNDTVLVDVSGEYNVPTNNPMMPVFSPMNITVNLGEGNNTATVSADCPVAVFAGNGNNRLTDNSVVFGNSSNGYDPMAPMHSFFVGNGKNVIVDNSDADVSILTGNGNNTIYGGDCWDSINLGNGNNTVYCGDAASWVILGTGSNTLHAGSSTTFSLFSQPATTAKNSFYADNGKATIQYAWNVKFTSQNVLHGAFVVTKLSQPIGGGKG